ncbi:MAG: aminoglycoside adenylyltransferase domain-containing protein [Planctomycetota bacterium]
MTLFKDLDEVLAALRDALQAELGSNLVGMYVQGSFAVGDPDEYSDCDWIVVIEEPIEDQNGLQRMHERIFDLPSRWAQHLEGSYFPRAGLRRKESGNRKLLYLDNGSRVLERSDHDDTWVVRWSLREHGVVLAGPHPSTLIDPVDPEDLKTEVRGFMRTWSRSLVEDPSPMKPLWHPRFTVVSHCRFLHTLESGRITSKRNAVDWALGRLDPAWRPLIEQSMAGRAEVWADPHVPADPDEIAHTVEFVQYALNLVGCGS